VAAAIGGVLTAMALPGTQSFSEAEIGRLRQQLVHSVRRTCPSWLGAEADDMVQTALLRVLDAGAKRRDGEGSAELATSYLRKAAYSAVVDEIRRRKRRREIPLEDDGVDMDAPIESGPIRALPANEPDPERRSVSREVARAIRSCLGEMVRSRRRAVTLYLQGHRIKEVGALMGWDPKRAENLIYRGLADLRACLDRQGVHA